MEKEDFDPRIIELAQTYSWVITGVLGNSWGIPLNKMKQTEDKDTEWVLAQLIFFLTKVRNIDDPNYPS